MTDKLSMLSDTEKAVVETITMRLNTKEALQYMKDAGQEICERTYFRQKKKVESLKWERLIHIANFFTEQHLQRIDKLELVESLMWKNYDAEKNPAKKVSLIYSYLENKLSFPYLRYLFTIGL